MQGLVSKIGVDVRDTILPLLIFALYVVYLAQAVTFPIGAKTASGLLLLLGLIAFCFSVAKKNLEFSGFVKGEKELLVAFALFSIVSIISFFYWPRSREAQMRLEDYGTFLLLLPLYMVMRQYQFNYKYVLGLLALIACLLGVVSIIQYISMAYFGQMILVVEGSQATSWLRPSGQVNPMRYAAISLILACFALNAQLLIRNKEFWLKVLLLAALGLALIACLLTKVRGSWLAFPVLLVAYGFYLYKNGHSKFLVGLLVAGLFLAIGVCQTQVVQSRVDAAVSNVNDYLAGNSNTSIGARFDMFKAAGFLIGENPVWGHGLYGYKAKAAEIRDATPGMSREVGMWSNPHNEILQVMVEKGVIGLITLVLLFAAPSYMFIKALYDRRVEVKYYAMNGLAILIVYAVAGQSVALFEHDVFNHFFALMILLFASQISVIKRAGSSAGGLSR